MQDQVRAKSSSQPYVHKLRRTFFWSGVICNADDMAFEAVSVESPPSARFFFLLINLWEELRIRLYAEKIPVGKSEQAMRVHRVSAQRTVSTSTSLSQ